MSRNKDLIKNTLIIGIGQFATKIVTFLLLPLYTAFLSKSEFGFLDIVQTIVSLAIPLLFFQIDQAVFRFLIDYREGDRRQDKRALISTITYGSILLSVIYSLIFLIVCVIFRQANTLNFLAFLNVLTATFLGVLLQVARGFSDNKSFTIASSINGILTAALSVLFVVTFRMGINGVMIGIILANLIATLYLVLSQSILLFLNRDSISKHKLKELLAYSLPLIPNQLSWWVVNLSDRFLITTILGVSENGVYAAANKISSIILSFTNIFNLSWSESAVIHQNDEDSHSFYSKTFNSAMLVFCALCALVISGTGCFFKFLIVREEYASSYYQIPILVISVFFNTISGLLGSIYVAKKASKEIAKTSIISAIINIVVNFLLIKNIGLFAASISTLIAYFTMTAYRYVNVQKYVKVQLHLKNIAIVIMLFSLVSFIYYSRSFVLNFLVTTLLVLIALVSGYKKFYKKLKSK